MRNPFSTILAAAALLLCSCNSSDKTVVGQIDYHEGFSSDFVESRTIRVWTPKGYNPSQKYDVIYMHDGQNLFDSSITWNHQEWGVDECLSKLIKDNKIRPCIVVGIDNSPSLRYEEYYPSKICASVPADKLPEGFKPLGDEYLRFVVEEVKPFVDSLYSTWTSAEHTFTIGSSCGGLIASYALCEYPEIFGGAACLSTHCSLFNPHSDMPQTEAASAYLDYLDRQLPTDEGHKLYMDRGDCPIDLEYAEPQAAINAMLETKPWSKDHYLYRFFPGKSHSETDWSERLDLPVTFLLKSR